MRPLNFVSQNGVAMVVEKYDEQRLKIGRKMETIQIVQKCGKRYAVLNGVSIYEEKNDPETWAEFFCNIRP